jgi:Flp pilus assembly protein, pilin Flp
MLLEHRDKMDNRQSRARAAIARCPIRVKHRYPCIPPVGRLCTLTFAAHSMLTNYMRKAMVSGVFGLDKLMNHQRMIMQLLRDQRGATAIEYGLICALLVLAIMVSVQGVANETNRMWDRVGTTVDRATNP